MSKPEPDDSSTRMRLHLDTEPTFTPATRMNFTVEVMTESAGQWITAPLIFATQAEAYGYARELASRWSAVKLFRCTEVKEPPNYTWDQWVGLTRVPQSVRIAGQSGPST